MVRKVVVAAVRLCALAALAVIAAAVRATPVPWVYASSIAGMADAGGSGIQIQNLDPSQGATIIADFYMPGGAWVGRVNLPLTAPGAAANIGVDHLSFPRGAYAAVIDADRQIAAIARTDWWSSGGAAIYSNPMPGFDVVLPLAARNYFGQSSIVAIQNLDTGAQAQVTVDFLESGSATPRASREYSIPAGTSIVLDLRVDDEFAELGGGFLGSIFVTSATAVGVMSFVDITTSDKAVYAFEGVPTHMASPTLYVPLFRSKQYLRPGDPGSGRLDTGIAVANPGTAPVDVTITYYGAGGTCGGEIVTSPTVQIAAHSSSVFYQGVPAGQGLKDGCYGSAVIQSSGGGILAIVNEAQNLNQASAAYNAVPAELGATTVALPLYRKNHANGLTTGISVMNVGTGEAQITLSLSQNNPNGTSSPVICGAACTQTVGPNRTAIFWPGSIAEIPSNSYGSAVVQSTQPVAVIVNDVNVFGDVDMATYNGIKADVPSGVGRIAVPLTLNVFALD